MSPLDAAARSGLFLRLALGFVYFFFGLLKFYPDLSPAEQLATESVITLSGGLLSPSQAIVLLAMLECAIGICFLFHLAPRLTLVLFMAHMAGTFTPLVFLPASTFRLVPFAPSMEGQYILKNFVFVAAGWSVLAQQFERERTAVGAIQGGTIPMGKARATRRGHCVVALSLLLLVGAVQMSYTQFRESQPQLDSAVRRVPYPDVHQVGQLLLD